MGELIDLTGQTFGKWIVLGIDENSNSNNIKWKCQCSCDEHTIRSVRGYALRSGRSKSCGCLRKDELQNLNGMICGNWKVLREVERDIDNNRQFLCECRCEKHTIRVIKQYSLNRNETNSCMCSNYKDLTGMKFGKLTVLRFDQKAYDDGKKNNKYVYKWICECDCKEKDKNIVSVSKSNLITGHTSSCGCYCIERIKDSCTQDLTNLRFGKLVVIKRDAPKISKKGNKTEMWLCQCDCGTIKTISHSALKQGRTISCGCIQSKMEFKAKKYFDKMSINYIQQYTYDDCKYKGILRFDFYLPNYDCCVEFDGIQHFEVVDFGGNNLEKATEKFRVTQIKDEIKNNYCKNNNIKLIRIPYWDFDNYKNILFDKLGIGGE
ncbi:hypothetical protein [Methanoculleus sp.]|jgi:hypothetical protein|uniref:hypothetical protein n=1 Tax=Methanoculleus sp. TaxID=90427 RepID=UPI0025D29A4C|nr:hypothetical protein [Methanoculleus sp.]MCK9319831.1 hypothetical protein [Methanoculleus sp.]